MLLKRILRIGFGFRLAMTFWLHTLRAIHHFAHAHYILLFFISHTATKFHSLKARVASEYDFIFSI